MLSLMSTLLSTVVLDQAADSRFAAWAHAHNRTYASRDARNQALHNFVANEAVIATLQEDELGSAVYGHTRFSDLSAAQFRQQYLGARARKEDLSHWEAPPPTATTPVVPKSFDWRDHGAVTPVKDQSSCGSCWAFSAVENVESTFYLHTKAQTAAAAPTVLSVEQILECDSFDYACYGGFPSGAFQYIQQAGGLSAESTYPYDVDGKTICLANQTFNATCGDGICDDPPLTNWCDLTCHSKATAKAARIDGWKALPSDEASLAAFLASSNPVSVAIDASGGALGVLFPWLQFYRHGVADPKRCKSDKSSLDHAVLLVGYGTDGGKDYWSVRNSWGVKFGEDGYFRLARGKSACGVDTLPSTSLVHGGMDAVEA